MKAETITGVLTSFYRIAWNFYTIIEWRDEIGKQNIDTKLQTLKFQL
jgi:hypothetical protein